MNTLADLEEQTVRLNALSSVSTKTLEQFADVSHSIAVRAQQIFRDLKPWEVAVENISETMEEMSKAAKCYHQPPVLKAVLSGKDTSPESIVKCADYLVFTEEYLSTHPPNEYGEIIQSQLGTQLHCIIEVSENYVLTAFTSSLKSPPTDVFYSSNDLRIIRNEKALEGVPSVLCRLSQNFNRTSVVQDDVKHLLATRLKEAVDVSFTTTCAARDFQNSMKGSKGLQSLYLHREHPLLSVSAGARRMVQEVAKCVDTHILQPMDEDFEVVDMPGELALSVFDFIVDKAKNATHFDLRVLKSPTEVFLLSRGRGVGYFPGVRTFQDVIFIALDMLEDLWLWKVLMDGLPGDNNEAKDAVDAEVDNFAAYVRELLNGYANTIGGIDKDLLKRSARASNRFEWLPALDCTAHESSTSLLYFQKMVFKKFFGALKVALFGCILDSSSEYQALKEVEDYFSRCVTSHMEDIRTIGTAAKELLQEAKRTTSSSRNSVSSPSPRAGLTVEVFVINNALFLTQSYKKANCFQKRVMASAVDEGTYSFHPGVTLVVTSAVTYLLESVEHSVADYRADWEACFPPIPDELEGETRILSKSQAAVAKEWYAASSAALDARLQSRRGEVVMDPTVRKTLFRESYEAVEESFQAMAGTLARFEFSDDAVQSAATAEKYLRLLRTVL